MPLHKCLDSYVEVRDLSQIQDIRGVETLVEVLPAKVGSPLSIKSLSDDLGYNQRTIARIVRRAERVEVFPGNCFIIPATNFLMLTG